MNRRKRCAMSKKCWGAMIVIGITLGLLSGCGSKNVTIDTNRENVENKKDEEQVEYTTEVAEITVPDVEVQKFEIPENEALTFVKEMKIGWNLGNTFDANTETNQFEDEMKYETIWCGVPTTKEMIDTVKAAGFNTVRIPVSWHNHLTDDNFTISQVWLDRVQEVVDYVMANDMYAIINIHHDISKAYYYPSNECLENSTKYMTSIWGQISERFKDYDAHLIFESVNEPRLVGDENEWWFQGDKANCKEAVLCINTLNQVFVDTVRKSQGKNETRYLMVPGYDAAVDSVLYEGFKLPTDSQENKIIVSVHAYVPYAFALQSSSESGSTDVWDMTKTKDQQAITDFMDGLYNKFIVNGTPVLIGEFGARDKNNNLQARVGFTTYYIAAARARGMSCLWWDNNSFVGSGENFGLLERRNNTWQYEALLEGLMKYAN